MILFPSKEATEVAAHQGAVSTEQAASLLRAGYAVDFLPKLAELREWIAQQILCGDHAHFIPNKTFVANVIRAVELIPHDLPVTPEAERDESDREQADRGRGDVCAGLLPVQPEARPGPALLRRAGPGGRPAEDASAGAAEGGPA